VTKFQSIVGDTVSDLLKGTAAPALKLEEAGGGNARTYQAIQIKLDGNPPCEHN